MAVDPFNPAQTGNVVVGTNASAQAVGVEGVRATYSYASITNTPAATPTDIWTLRPTGSLIARISRIEIGGQAGTAGVLPIRIGLRSTVNSSGTSTAPTPVAHNPLDAASSCTLALYTANPTLGTLVGYFRNSQVFLNVATAAADRLVWDFGIRNEKAIVVPVGYTFFINGNGAAVPTSGTLDISVTWEEGQLNG